MLNSHERFYSENGKRLVLVADDEFINREILSALLAQEYEVLTASNGIEAVEQIRENAETLSLVMLDLVMPEMNGIEVLKAVKNDPKLRNIPIIVITSDHESEVESLTLGAADFIPKPFPQPGIISARVKRNIELSEDRMIINSTERDPLTELYNREFFYRYADQFDNHHKSMEMDALVVDIFHFHTINERFGTSFGDRLLKLVSDTLREAVRDSGGIVCRREADTFLIYCPHGYDYAAFLDKVSAGINGNLSSGSRVRLRMGVYENVNKELPIERRFDRASMAADKVRGSLSNNIGVFDNSMHEKELYAAQLIDDFAAALSEKQFAVYFQPKFDIRPKKPVLASAEALVRWNHPTLGMISPAVFIPLFEENGLICQLDNYVWRETAAKISDWKKRLGFFVPVSVNVSRVDMFEPGLSDNFRSVLEEFSLGAGDIILEITESAYTKDSDQIVSKVEALRDIGFRIEMDDFGTGYSSLNMISDLPIDALKLDMQFIRRAFSDRKDTRLIKAIIDIAEYLSVPVIAEGVETEEQLIALKAMGCDLVQGYYFSKPVPAAEFESFLITRKKQLEDERRRMVGFSGIAQALSRDYICIYCVNTDTDDYTEYGSKKDYAQLGIAKDGVEFFSSTRRNAVSAVHPDDLDMFLSEFSKEGILHALEHFGVFTLTYRLIICGMVVYVHMKIACMEEGDTGRIVVGLSDISEQIRRESGLLREMRTEGRIVLTHEDDSVREEQ